MSIFYKGRLYRLAEQNLIDKCTDVTKEIRERTHLDDATIKSKKRLAELWNGTAIYLVDGNEVRNKKCVEFTEGGHWLVHPFIPENEIWLEKLSSRDDMEHNLGHEILESSLMQYGKFDYDAAHNAAAMTELLLRNLG